MKSQDFIKIIGIGVIIWFLTRKKKSAPAPAMRSGGGGGGGASSGGGGLFSPSNLSSGKRNQIAARVKKEVSKLNLDIMPDDDSEFKRLYEQDQKDCKI